MGLGSLLWSAMDMECSRAPVPVVPTLCELRVLPKLAVYLPKKQFSSRTHMKMMNVRDLTNFCQHGIIYGILCKNDRSWHLGTDLGVPQERLNQECDIVLSSRQRATGNQCRRFRAKRLNYDHYIACAIPPRPFHRDNLVVNLPL